MSHTSTNATRLLQERLGVKPLEERPDPSVLRGILQTMDYQRFEIHDDVGTTLHRFEGAKYANRCLPGDHVYWDGSMCQLELRDEHPLLVGVIELTHPARYGFTSHRVPLCLFTPYDTRYPPMVVGCSERDKTRNRLGIVQWMNWPTTSVFPRGALQRVLGLAGDIEAEKKAILHLACPWKYPAHPFQPRLLDGPSTRRVTLAGTTFHIDPEGCRDVDDVFTIETLDDCLWRVTITISDVAAFVEDGGAIDIMASLISQTVYSDTGTVLAPMLPVEYSECACSLLPNKTSYGLSLQFLWNGACISDCSWFESVFVTHHSYTYTSFLETAPSSLSRVVQDVASFLAGRVVDDPHEWVEQWMLYYNKQAGQALKAAQMGILRRHPPADRERWERYQANLPEWKHLAMSSATYALAEEEDTYHHGLETDGYAHTTSPIRRYADLVNQRALKQYLHVGISRFIVPVTMVEMNRREKVIKQFAREMTFLEALRTGHILTQAVVLEKEPVDGECRVRFYVPEWKKTVSAFYPLSPDGSILSRDGTKRLELREFSTVTLQCSSYATHRHPKQRMLFQVLSDGLPQDQDHKEDP